MILQLRKKTYIRVIMSFLISLSSYIFIILVLVFVHEFGHYIIAKWSGVKIDTFSLGFGKEICGRNDKSGTRWKISAIPLGGYVKMYGDASEASTPLEEIDNLSEEEKKYTFYHKPLYKKAAIVVAGPLANFLLTIAIFTAFIIISGLPSIEPIIGDVMKDSPAQAAGLLPNDRIITIDAKEVDSFNQIQRTLLTNLGTPVNLQIKRDDKIMEMTITPKTITEKDSLGNDFTHPIIGITSKKVKIEEVGFFRAVWEATIRTYHFCAITLKAIGQIIVGDRRFLDNVQGPIAMAKMSGQAASKGIDTVFLLMANISASLGLVNLFPIPVLDGGHLLFYALEAVRGRPLARKFQDYGMRVGMAIVVMLMTTAILHDIYKWLLTFTK